jgi:hypothetical protein
VRTFDPSPLRDVYQRHIGDCTVFIPDTSPAVGGVNRSVLVVPNDTATEAKRALDSVTGTID